MNKKHMITLKRSQLVKMITQPTVTRLKTRCWSKVMQEINFTGNQEKKKNATIFFIIEEAKETVLDFSKGIIKVLWFNLF